MSAVRVARAFTAPRQDRQVRGLLPTATPILFSPKGSGATTLGVQPVPACRVGGREPYHALQRSRRGRGLCESYAKQVAAIIVEPIAGNMGVVAPVSGFLDGCATSPRATGSCSFSTRSSPGFARLPEGRRASSESIRT